MYAYTAKEFHIRSPSEHTIKDTKFDVELQLVLDLDT